jgi:hypothetical protein
MVYLKLMEDFVTDDDGGGRNDAWLLTAVARAVSIAAVNDKEEKSHCSAIDRAYSPAHYFVHHRDG